MNDSASLRDDLNALNELIVNCPDFDRLEGLLGGFNLFQVLKFEHGEIRHSNVLAWILDPEESHGLGSTFLQKWLMRIVHEAGGENETPIAAVDIDGWSLASVEVRREWRHIDLLVVLTFASEKIWVIAIENKVNSQQHSHQLSRYRTIVESDFPEAEKRMYLFLTRDDEEPEDDAYLPVSYTQVHRCLEDCLRSRAHTIGPEPRVLLENYLRLLEERFMDDSEIARTALRIYQQHRRALDVIFEHRPDSVGAVSDAVRELLESNAEALGIVMGPCNKGVLRFLPRQWDVPGNTHGRAWPGSNRTVAIELNFAGAKTHLFVIVADAPVAWIEPLWKRSKSAPFRPTRRTIRPKKWCTVHVMGGAKVAVDDDAMDDPAELAQRIYDWIVSALKEPNSQKVFGLIAAELPHLDELLQAETSRGNLQ